MRRPIGAIILLAILVILPAPVAAELTVEASYEGMLVAGPWAVVSVATGHDPVPPTDACQSPATEGSVSTCVALDPGRTGDTFRFVGVGELWSMEVYVCWHDGDGGRLACYDMWLDGQQVIGLIPDASEQVSISAVRGVAIHWYLEILAGEPGTSPTGTA